VSYSKLILKDRPDIVWAFDNINESSSVSLPINFYSDAATTYSASINASLTSVWSIPIVYGGGLVVKLSNSSSANISIPLLSRFSELYGRRESCIEFWLRLDKVPGQETRIATKRNNPNIGLYVRENYLIYRYGTSSSYIEASYGLAELNEPTHVVLNHNPGGIELIVNGISTITSNENSLALPIDSSHSTNDYMDFYGSASYNTLVDCIAIYPFNLGPNTAKSHYVYGLGKNINESIFTGMGGDFYNLSTQSTRKSFYDVWEDPTDWTLIRYDNLVHSIEGIRPYVYDIPDVVSFDNKINTVSNQISFTSSIGATTATYFQIEDLPTILNSGLNPFFVKVRFDGGLPTEGFPQTIMSYGQLPYSPILDFNLTNTSGSYYLVAKNNPIGSSVSFLISNITSSPTAIIGMSYDNQAVFYFGLSGSALQSASLTNYSGSVFGVDPMTNFFPPTNESIIRIGSGLTYDNNSTISEVGNIQQFLGTFLSFMVAPDTFSASTFSQVDTYSQPVYSLIYDSSKNRFRNRSYGTANFIIHGATLASVLDSGSAVISANRFEFGYPDVVSGSEVSIYATLYDYSASIVRPKTKLQKVNSLEWINLIDLNNKYLYFDIDILAEDSFYYPPTIRYFKGETYPYSGSYVEILDNGGDRIRIYSASTASSQIYVPELELTPTMFLIDSSGARVYRNNVDIEFSPLAKSLNVSNLSNLLLWYDSRFPNGLTNTPYADSASNTVWRSLSGSAISASVVSLNATPHYREQSLNILTTNQMNGSESGSVTVFTGSWATLTSSNELASSGTRSIKVVPDGTSSDSFMDFGMYTNTSSVNRFIFPGQQYTVVGTVGLLKSQSVAESRARRIVIYSASTSPFGVLATASSTASSNAPGLYFASVTFTAPSGTNWISVRFYNGSSVSGDPVYWDNMAIYSGSVISGSPVVFYEPLEVFDDRPVYKFNGLTQYFTSNISINQPMSVYIVARVFGASGTLIGNSASAPAIYYQSNTFRMGAGQELIGASVNSNFNVIAGIFNNNSSSLFVNSSAVSGNVGTGSYTSAVRVGYRQTPSGANSYLSGDVAAVVIFNTAHTKIQVDEITDWMRDAFNIA